MKGSPVRVRASAFCASAEEYEIERMYRHAPLLVDRRGDAEIWRGVIGRQLLERHKI
jgi:hypothetical protein